MEIIDDFLPQEAFEEIQRVFLGKQFSWYFIPYINHNSEHERNNLDWFEFCHLLWDPDGGICSESATGVIVIFKERLDAYMWLRIKANLTVYSENPQATDFHTDFNHPMPIDKITTAIYYVNTTNGYTEFIDGRKVESVANRLVKFPCNLRHQGTTCSDTKQRVVINFNYFDAQGAGTIQH